MSKTPAVALHGFICSTNFGDMLLSRLTADIVRRRSPGVALPFASRTFIRAAGIATRVRTFLSAKHLGRRAKFIGQPQHEPLLQSEVGGANV